MVVFAGFFLWVCDRECRPGLPGLLVKPSPNSPCLKQMWKMFSPQVLSWIRLPWQECLPRSFLWQVKEGKHYRAWGLSRRRAHVSLVFAKVGHKSPPQISLQPWAAPGLVRHQPGRVKGIFLSSWTPLRSLPGWTSAWTLTGSPSIWTALRESSGTGDSPGNLTFCSLMYRDLFSFIKGNVITVF